MNRAVLEEIADERFAQDQKWGVQDHRDYTPVENTAGDPLVSTDTLRWIADSKARGFEGTQLSFMDILLEEVGEARDDAAIGHLLHLRQELVQVAAVAVAWIESIDRRTDG